MWLSYDEIVTLIRVRGKSRWSAIRLYQTVRTFEGTSKPQAAPGAARGPGAARLAIPDRASRAAAARPSSRWQRLWMVLMTTQAKAWARPTLSLRKCSASARFSV